MAYEKRRYRSFMEGAGLVIFQVMVRETDLWISAESDLSEQALRYVRQCRRILEQAIRRHPDFLTTLDPLEVDRDEDALIQTMAKAGRKTGVGPMAAVAGAVAEYVGRELLRESGEVIVENGGDVFLASTRERTVSIFAGESPFSHRVAIRIEPDRTPLGLCTSSGTVGHSMSKGHADSVTVLAPSAALADAAATAAGNRVLKGGDIQKGLDFIASVPGLQGGLIVVGSDMGAWGDLELVEL